MLFGLSRAFAKPPSWGVAIVIFLAVTTTVVYVLLRNKTSEKLTSVYLLSITGKIIFACVFVITFILLDKPGANYNVVFFLVGYFTFTAAEVVFLLLKKTP